MKGSSFRFPKGILLLFIIVPVLIESVEAGEDDWPRFRGPGGAGTGSGFDCPGGVDKTAMAWTVALPGPGSSSPVVWGPRIFVTSEDRLRGLVHLECRRVDDGSVLWKRTVEVGPYRTHKMNNTAAATPAVDQDMVVFSWYHSGRKVAVLSAYCHKGKHLWDYDIGSFKGAHGLNLMPVIHKGSVIFAHLHQQGGYVASIKGATGLPDWKTPYPRPSPKTTYMTPLIRRLDKDPSRYEVVISSTSTGVCGINLENGKEAWSLPGVFKERCIVSPVNITAGGGLPGSIITAGCKKEGGNNVFVALRPPEGGEGRAELLWQLEQDAPYVPTPVSDGKTLFVLSDRGIIQAVDPRTGQAQWAKKLQGNFYASPLLVGSTLLCLSRDGEMYSIDVKGGGKVLRVYDLEPGDEVTWVDSSPALAGNSLFLRVGARLDCYRSK
ncbi:MAG: hypothetical protein CMN02_09815 [Roseibacillus sp.]|nr:hypothetical protein [Roseibacillus sp.]